MTIITDARKYAIIATLKEAFRIALFAGLSALALWIGQKLTTLDPTTTDWLVGTFLLRLIDKYINKNQDNSYQGISPI